MPTAQYSALMNANFCIFMEAATTLQGMRIYPVVKRPITWWHARKMKVFPLDGLGQAVKLIKNGEGYGPFCLGCVKEPCRL